jgi:threonyl-tRNA synthetase
LEHPATFAAKNSVSFFHAKMKLAKETEFAAGYVRVRTPHLAKEKMYKTSGHLPYYAESMFPPMEMDEHRADRQKIETRIAELEKQLSDHAKKKSGE